VARRNLARIRFERWLLLLATLVVVLMIGTSTTLKLAANDLYAAADEIRGVPRLEARTSLGRALSARLAPDVAPSDLSGNVARADEFNYRADRVRELAGLAATIGLLIALLSAPAATLAPPRPETS
jgi:hypothetical protein